MFDSVSSPGSSSLLASPVTSRASATEYRLSDGEKERLGIALKALQEELVRTYPCKKQQGVAEIPEEARGALLQRLSGVLHDVSPGLYQLAEDYFHQRNPGQKPGLLLHHMPFDAQGHSARTLDMSRHEKWQVAYVADLFRLALEAIERDNVYAPGDKVQVFNRRVSPDTLLGQRPHMDFKFGYCTFACHIGNEGVKTCVFDVNAAVRALPEEMQALLQQPYFTVISGVEKPIRHVIGSDIRGNPLVTANPDTGTLGLVYPSVRSNGYTSYLHQLQPVPDLKRTNPELYQKARDACAAFREKLEQQKDGITLRDNDFLIIDQRRTLHAGSIHRSLNHHRWLRISGWGEGAMPAKDAGHGGPN